MNLSRRLTALALALGSLVPCAAQAQDYPSRNVSIVVGSVIVENKAAPDGHTLLLGSAGDTAINPFVYKGRMQYDPAKDLVPVTLVKSWLACTWSISPTAVLQAS